jgi:hypothetical protein
MWTIFAILLTNPSVIKFVWFCDFLPSPCGMRYTESFFCVCVFE